ncbi:protein mono-ADP-ribosyltransferase PARP14-like isoform X2 [Mya arenaria]|uniref:protein mono-ADP-ribosyltransferase PARP14-like isoform X2 n=1 Tax=Mya arenaria TaxID=6604 RepID=UPI0022E425EF|nr:protein mono-ADP-ribosyltransferase PARP14-like isoform X2 [Mya arenaria]
MKAVYRKEGDSKATTTDGGHTRHDNAPSYSNWDAARHYGALGGHRYVYPPVPRDVWRQQMQQPNMYANYPGNTPYLGSPQPQGPVGQLQMHYGNQPYFNQMAYQQNSPMWNPPPTFSTEPAPSVHAQPITRNSAAERDETNVRVDNRQTGLKKNTPNVERGTSDGQRAFDSDLSASIIVRGIPKAVSRDVLELFFENKARSGGGSVHDLKLNKRLGIALVQFEDLKDAQNVLQKAASTGTLHLPTSKCDVEVNRFEETKHAQYFNEIPHTSLFIKNLPIDSSNETIKSYFEVRCKAKPTDVIRSISRKTALFEFEEAIDIAAMTKTCGHKPLEGNILAILEVDTTRQVKVSGVRAGTSPQVLELYFENHARSKGGEIETVDVVGEEKAFIVTFVHPEDARQVALAPHILDGMKLSVNLYNALLDTDPDSVVTIPEVVDVTGIDKNIVRFLKHSKYYRERAENCAKDVFGKLLWKNEDGSMSLQISCDVNPTDSDVLRKVNIWEENHTKCFDWISKEIVTIELTDVFEQILSDVKRDMEGMDVKNPDRVITFLKNRGLSIIVVGEKHEGEMLANTIKQNILRCKRDYEERTKQVTEIEPLKWYESILFKDKRVFKLLETTDVEIRLGNMDGITFSGANEDVQKSLMNFNEVKQRVKKHSIQDISEQCLELLGTVEMQRELGHLLSQKDILAVCSNVSREIFTFEFNPGDADRAVKLARSCVTGLTLNLAEEQISCLNSEDGIHFIKQIMDEHQGLLSIVLSRSGCVKIACLNTLPDDIANEIDTFVQANTRYELFCRAHTEVVRYINMHARYALSSTEKDHDVKITKHKENGEYDGFIVAGQMNSAKNGLRKVEDVCKGVAKHNVSIDWPGFIDYLQSQNGKYDISQVEQEEKCLIAFTRPLEEKQHDMHTRADKRTIGIKIVAEGSIVYQKVDVIVNSSNRKLDMETGVVSKQLLKVAGAELQAECTRKYPKGIHFGKVAKTAAGRMGNCKAIFHGALPRWTTANAQNVLEEFMAECLKSADKKGYTTIAFPALGTGRCEYPSDVVADTLLTSVMEYENDHPDTNIKCVSFVIWSKDVETIKAFTKTKEELTRQRSRKERRRSEPEPRRQTQATVLTVYTNKPRNIKQIESRIKGFKKDEEIFPPASLLEQLTDDRMEVVKKIARENKVKLVKTDKSLKLVGYGKSVERTKKKVESYLDNAEKDLKLTFQTLGTKGVPFPPSWSKTDITDPLKIVQLPPTDPDFVTVSKQFLADTGLPPTNIVKIERIQNPALYGQYFAKKKHMESAGGGPKIERMLWHGTRTPQVANNITSKGFDRNYNHGASHGAGVYFAMNAQMSANGYCAPDAMGQKYIFYANVLTGDFWVGSSGIRVPPPKVPGNTLVTYDSTTDNVAAPNFFVIFHDAQAYPSFMITFK